MACNCRGSGPGVVIFGDDGVNVSGAGTLSEPFHISTSLADSVIFEARDTATVNLTITGSGSVEDPYILRADTGSVTALTSLSDVISDAPTAGAVPTWVAATPTVPGHWSFIVPSAATFTSLPASGLTGVVPDVNLPGRLGSYAQLLPVGGDWNTVTTTGFYRGNQVANAPTLDGSWWYVEVIAHDSTGKFCIQRASSYFPGQAPSPLSPPTAAYATYERRNWAGTWGAWSRIITNDDLNNGIADGLYPNKAKVGSVSQAMMPFTDASGKTGVTVTTAAGGGYQGTATVAFPSGRFTNPPQMLLTAEDSTAASNKVSVVPGSVTATGFTIYVWRTASVASGGYIVYWHARDSRNS